jgi:hypothetical protein
MLARDLAAELLDSYFQQVEARGSDFDASLYQTPDGGIALFPYADDDLALSARVAALAPERVGRTALAAYFLDVTEDRDQTRERQIIALYGLAALGDPVLLPIQALRQEKDLTWRERLYLGLAAQQLGDDETARAVYRGLIDDFGESRAPLYRLRVAPEQTRDFDPITFSPPLRLGTFVFYQDATLEATSLAAILAAGLGETLAPALFDYTTSNYTRDILIELEQVSYLTQALPRLSPEAVRFAYTVEGKREEVTLERGRSFSIQVTPDELLSLWLEPIDGRVGVAAFYTAPIDQADFKADPDIGVTRRYGGSESGSVVLSEGDLVRITLAVQLGPQALDGCYQVSDLLPSGLKPITRPSRWGLGFASYPYRIDGQRVSFCVSKGRFGRTRDPTYFARVVSAGEYIAEPVIIQSMKSAESVSLSTPDFVEIR